MLYCEATGKLPEELEESDTDIIWNNACNHCSMFLTWAIMRGYCGESHLSDEPEAVEKVKEREMTGTEFLSSIAIASYGEKILRRSFFHLWTLIMSRTILRPILLTARKKTEKGTIDYFLFHGKIMKYSREH
jgi:hypothetical protein